MNNQKCNDIRLIGRYTQTYAHVGQNRIPKGKMFCFTALYNVRAVVFDTNEFHTLSARLSVGNVLQKRHKIQREWKENEGTRNY